MITTPFNQLPTKKRRHMASKLLQAKQCAQIATCIILPACDFKTQYLDDAILNHLNRAIKIIDDVPRIFKSCKN